MKIVKHILIILLIVPVLFITGCNKKEKEEIVITKPAIDQKAEAERALFKELGIDEFKVPTASQNKDNIPDILVTPPILPAIDADSGTSAE